MLGSSRYRFAAALLTGTALFGLASCGNTSGSTSDGVGIVVGAYPFEFAASRVAGELASVTNLLTPGADGHDLELSPQQVASVADADLVVYQSGYQAAMDEAISQQEPAHVLDTGDFLTLRPASGEGHDHDHEGEAHDHESDTHDHESDTHDHGAYDPHVWLNPENMAAMGDQIAAVLGQIDPDNSETYLANAAALRAEMTVLDDEFAGQLVNCRTQTFVTNHAAFGYLAERYGLQQVGISGLSTESEPSPARIAEVQQVAREHELTTIFYETAVSPKVAESIASDLGLTTDVLDPLETLSEESRGSDYIEVMNANLAALTRANGCQ